MFDGFILISIKAMLPCFRASSTGTLKSEPPNIFRGIKMLIPAPAIHRIRLFQHLYIYDMYNKPD